MQTKSKAGRKKKMDTNNFYGWFDAVVTAYLNNEGTYKVVQIDGPLINRLKKYDDSGVKLKTPVKETVPFRVGVSSRIVLSMRELEMAFGRPGADCFKSFFTVVEGVPRIFDAEGASMSHAFISTDPDRREALMQYIEGADLLGQINQGQFSFVSGHRDWRERMAISLPERMRLRDEARAAGRSYTVLTAADRARFQKLAA